jgi:hypothetical protein
MYSNSLLRMSIVKTKLSRYWSAWESASASPNFLENIVIILSN